MFNQPFQFLKKLHGFENEPLHSPWEVSVTRVERKDSIGLRIQGVAVELVQTIGAGVTREQQAAASTAK